MSQLVQYIEAGAGAAVISARIETAISDGRLSPGEQLPTVRELAGELGVSPATVAAAYRTLRQRGVITANRRLGTIVAAQPPLRVRGARPLPANTRDLTSGNPDPGLLPPLEPALRDVDPVHKLYGGPATLPGLAELASADFAADGIAGDLAVAGGALDGIERVLQTQLRPGDRVVVEDPCWPRIPDLVRAVGLQPKPVPVDQRGLVPEALEQALEQGARAVIATPRGQNPTGAAVDPQRGRALSEVLGGHPGAVLIEDDYLAAIAGVPYVSLHEASPRWTVIRSVSKVLGPDLRIALMAGDGLTISQVEGRQLLGPGWMSHLVQQLVAHLWTSAKASGLLAHAERTYAERRAALVDALARHGITGYGTTGLGVWVPLTEEAETVQRLLQRGWAVSPGERFRFHTPPGMRITTTALQPAEAEDLADAINETLNPATATYAG